MKYLIFDSGSLINFASNSLLNVLRDLKKAFPGEFLVTKKIIDETMDYPLKVKRFEWGALRVKELLTEGVIKQAEGNIVDANELGKRAREIMNNANNTFFAKNKAIHLIDLGEAECLALSRMLDEKKQENALVIDERTARVLVEKPENLQKLLSKKLHTKIEVTANNFNQFRGFRIIRSTELAYIAYKRGFIKTKGDKALEAVTYALKFGGVSISEKEAQKYKVMR